MEDLSKIFERLKKGIELPVMELPEGGGIKIKNFDSGSFWIDLIIPVLFHCYSLEELHSQQ